MILQVEMDGTPYGTNITCDSVAINYIKQVTIEHSAGEYPSCTVVVDLPVYNGTVNGYIEISDPYKYSMHELIAIRNAIDDEITQRNLDGWEEGL